jgi:hypothetical protein
MNLDTIANILTALQEGEALSNSTIWKNKALWVNAVVPGITFIPLFYDVSITSEQAGAIAGIAFTFTSLFNNFIHAATTTKIGLRGKSQKIDKSNPES